MTSVSIQPRPYQADAVDGAFGEFQRGNTSSLVILPTGTGKTVVAGLASRRAFDDFGRRTLFLAHTDALVNQAAATYKRFGFQTAIEMAELDAQDDEFFGERPEVVVASVQTMQGPRLRSWDPHSFGQIITDECHHAAAKSYRNIYGHFRDCWHLGITATPDRGDGKNIGRIFQSIAYELSLKTAIKDGWLVPIRFSICETTVSLKDIKTTGGDLNLGDLEDRIGPHVEELCKAANAVIGTRKTVCFTPDVTSSQAVADVFRQLGRRAAWIAGQPRMTRPEQQKILTAYASGDLDLLVCCDKLTEGWDDPPTETVIIMRPTRKRGKFAQMIGRGTRRSDGTGKTDCQVVIFDWEGASQHDLVQPFELFDDSNADDDVMAELEKLSKLQERAGGERQLDLLALLEQAEEMAARKAKLKIRVTDRKASFRTFDLDPLGIGKALGLGLNKGWHTAEVGQPITAKQSELLVKLGFNNPEQLNRMGASKAISQMFKRRDRGLATAKQVRYLIGLGLDPKLAREARFDQVQGYINQLKG